MFDNITELLPFLIPFAVIQGGLWIAAFIHILRSRSFRFGNRLLWVILSFVAVIGPVLYFVIGRNENGGDE